LLTNAFLISLLVVDAPPSSPPEGRYHARQLSTPADTTASSPPYASKLFTSPHSAAREKGKNAKAELGMTGGGIVEVDSKHWQLGQFFR
jgi:hypothetical protein